MKKLHNEQLKQQFIRSSGFLNQFSFDVSLDTQLFFFPANSYIVKENQPPTHLFYLVKGKAKLYDTLANGKLALIDFFSPPCFIGEMELVDENQTAFSVQAIDDCWCLALAQKDCQKRLLSDTLFLQKLCIYFAHKNYRNIKASTKNQGYPLSQRLASFILLTQNEGIYREKHTQVAEYLGVSYRHLLYVFAHFVEKGYIIKEKKHYLILDSEKLTQLAAEVKMRSPQE
ncbi:transcriptional regulator YeiL [Candidatus Enterococcus murrayae]|uniref:Transcriptional regulator YeiL n=1 Tax=Candidatus Enterococcus murrayae TaxID=2815321 RepID=A0ABS3HEI6_9ENTE|nr:transcriptional regulator YeiL [Enterococcus sp. MJM16]MBO0451866.1 transcriptional regulator YeiL [Enterococcus sp. MJM16]